MEISSIEFDIIGPAFLAGLLVLSTHVPLGREVLRRGIIFIDLAIAQIAGLGVIAAYGMGWDVDGWQVQLVAASSAVGGALFLYWLEHRFHESLEALIGVIFILAASTGILLLANNPHGGEHLRELLTGQILWVDVHHLMPVAGLYTLLLMLWFSLRSKSGSLVFYMIFALAVTASVQLVGVYLVFSSLDYSCSGDAEYQTTKQGAGIGLSGRCRRLCAGSDRVVDDRFAQWCDNRMGAGR